MIFIPCECGSDGIVIEHDDEGETYLSIWEYGLARTSSWRYRFRTIWRILRHGTPYGDSIILKESGCKALAEAVLPPAATEEEES